MADASWHRYLYRGPVMKSNRCVYNCWEAETLAPSEKKARANLEFRFKKEMGLIRNVKISLANKVIAID